MGKNTTKEKAPHQTSLVCSKVNNQSNTIITLFTRPLANFILEDELDNKEKIREKMQRTQVFFENSALLEMLKR